jgi:hypothetical protein
MGPHLGPICYYRNYSIRIYGVQGLRHRYLPGPTDLHPQRRYYPSGLFTELVDVVIECQLESTCMPKSQVDCHKFQGSALDFQLDVAVMNPVGGSQGLDFALLG